MSWDSKNLFFWKGISDEHIYFDPKFQPLFVFFKNTLDFC